MLTHHKLPEVAARLARIEGHVKGIRKMIDEGKGYPDIIHQIAAVKAGLDGAMSIMIEDLIEHVTECTSAKGKKAVVELKESVSKIL